MVGRFGCVCEHILHIDSTRVAYILIYNGVLYEIVLPPQRVDICENWKGHMQSNLEAPSRELEQFCYWLYAKGPWLCSIYAVGQQGVRRKTYKGPHRKLFFVSSTNFDFNYVYSLMRCVLWCVSEAATSHNVMFNFTHITERIYVLWWPHAGFEFVFSFPPNTRVIKKVNFHFLLNVRSAIFFLVLNLWKNPKENFDLSL